MTVTPDHEEITLTLEDGSQVKLHKGYLCETHNEITFIDGDMNIPECRLLETAPVMWVAIGDDEGPMREDQ